MKSWLGLFGSVPDVEFHLCEKGSRESKVVHARELKPILLEALRELPIYSLSELQREYVDTFMDHKSCNVVSANCSANAILKKVMEFGAAHHDERPSLGIYDRTLRVSISFLRGSRGLDVCRVEAKGGYAIVSTYEESA